MLAERITISVGGDSIVLRPSLRVAMRIERRPGSFAKLIQEIGEDSLGAAMDIIRDHAEANAYAVLDVLPVIKPALLSYVFALAGIDPEDEPDGDKAKGKSIPFSEHLIALYRIGTGHMGWTPKETLDATPAEILEAHRGRVEFLQSIFGKPEKHDTSTMTLDEKAKAAFAGFTTVKVKRTKVN